MTSLCGHLQEGEEAAGTRVRIEGYSDLSLIYNDSVIITNTLLLSYFLNKGFLETKDVVGKLQTHRVKSQFCLKDNVRRCRNGEVGTLQVQDPPRPLSFQRKLRNRLGAHGLRQEP